ncbi:MAG: tetratricopeptide repeat protein [Methanobrevibacter sp.]|uniref:tetratricopeptide repeat protein n=1 Tax=Methanobrevibacter sp. TaxID=66852 RepID=UPI0025F19AF9|nr:tetratricopeptide repeat protein [Methanobrevibacter sp.]MBE6508728.1 tetratricopeptide repeat protein [Methanobrevibacter sp.]
MNDSAQDFEEIKVNKRSTDRLYFETPIIQSIYNRIEFLKKEQESLLEELDSTELKQKMDSFDIERLGEESINRVYDAVDDASKIKDNIIDSLELPDFVKDYSNNMKFALNRDQDYVRKAKRKLKADDYLSNVRIVELCDKAIEVNYRNWEAYYIKGIALINLDKYDDAIEELTKSLALNEGNVDAIMYIAFAHMFKMEYANAIALFDHVLEIDKNSFDALKGKALTYYYWKKYGEAVLFFKKASSIKSLDEKSKEIWDICLEKS